MSDKIDSNWFETLLVQIELKSKKLKNEINIVGMAQYSKGSKNIVVLCRCLGDISFLVCTFDGEYLNSCIYFETFLDAKKHYLENSLQDYT